MIETGLYQGHGSGMELVRSGRIDWQRYTVIDANPDNVVAATEDTDPAQVAKNLAHWRR